jgi:hypothetical protein
MHKIQGLLACLGSVFFVGCASTGDLSGTQIFDDGTLIEYSAAGNPVRYTDTSGKLLVKGLSLRMEQVFEDGTRIQYSASGEPARYTDTSGRVFYKTPAQTLSSL